MLPISYCIYQIYWDSKGIAFDKKNFDNDFQDLGPFKHATILFFFFFFTVKYRCGTFDGGLNLPVHTLWWCENSSAV